LKKSSLCFSPRRALVALIRSESLIEALYGHIKTVNKMSPHSITQKVTG
jgi:hypothetical protein